MLIYKANYRIHYDFGVEMCCLRLFMGLRTCDSKKLTNEDYEAIGCGRGANRTIVEQIKSLLEPRTPIFYLRANWLLNLFPGP